MEESGVTKIISVRLENENLSIVEEPSANSEFVFEEEEVEFEEGRELPIGVDDPAQVSEESLRPLKRTIRRGPAGKAAVTDSTGDAGEPGGTDSTGGAGETGESGADGPSE
jgi:chromosome segregation protein